MRTHLFRLMIVLALLVSLFPATAAFADDDDDGNFEFKGIIENLPASGLFGDWTVSGRIVHVSVGTEIEQEHGAVALNACVEVKGWLQGDGSVNATQVETQEPWECPDGGDDDGGQHTEFYGTIQSLPASGWIGDWTVSGRIVHVNTSTQIEQEHGPVAVGAYVEVKGNQQTDGSVNATEIEVKMGAGSGGGGSSYIEFYGTIQSLPASGWIGDWTVSGRTVRVDASTRIEQEHGPVAVGAYVEVKGWSQSGNVVNATKIEVKSGSDGGSGGSSGSYTKFYGTVEQLPASGLIGTWIVSGRTVQVNANTRIEQEHGPVTVGAYVEVKGTQQTGGAVSATEIEVKDSPDDDDDGGGSGNYTKFYGTVEQLPASGLIGTWSVNGRAVVVSANTRIEQEHGQVAVGAYVEVEGALQTNGSVNATKIEVKSSPGGGSGGGSVGYVKFYGIIEDLPVTGLVGDWMVSGRTVHVTNQTRIEQEHGTVQLGAYVEVKGVRQSDSSVNAAKIEVKR